MTPSLPIRPIVSSTLQASKWQTCAMLIDIDEMRTLIKELSPFWMVRISGVIAQGEEFIDPSSFMDLYEVYIHSLKQGKMPEDARLRPYFSSIWTRDLNSLYAVPVQTHHYLIKPIRPLIQLQAHHFAYSTADGKFRSMVFGPNSITWGIQFSYPHLYQDENYEIHVVRENSQFPNTVLFKSLQRWMRQHTIASPFLVNDKKINVPIRLGKNCLGWINHHPQLQKHGLSILKTYL